MKNTKKLFALVLCALLILSLCACGSDGASSSSNAGSTDEYSGDYTAFGIAHDDYPGYIVDLGDQSSELKLNEDGTGVMTLSTEDHDGEIESWGVKNGEIEITISGKTQSGAVKDGKFIELYVRDSSVTIYYAKAGADTSSYNVLSQEAFKESVSSE